MKVFKQNNKFVVYLPNEVVKELKLNEGDDVDFFRYNASAFLFMNKSQVASLLIGTSVAPHPVVQTGKDFMGNEELAVLKKLDTVRYPQRTKERVSEMLDSKERETLQQLVKKRMVSTFKKNNVELYSISKSVYDKFLMRKKQPASEQAPQARVQPRVQLSGHTDGPYSQFIKDLEENGFLVVQTEAEAGGVSLALEQSIRHGKVLGVRAFNRKFYIVTRQFFDAHNGAIIKAVKDGASKVDAIAGSAGMSEDAARAILYLLSESGDIRERRRDTFAMA